MNEDFEEEVKLLNLARSVGLSSMYDASRASYSTWRNKILAFAQLVKEHEFEQTVRPNHFD